MRRRRLLEALAVAATGVAGCTSGPRKSGPEWGPPATEPATPTEDLSTLEPTTAADYGLETGFTYETATEGDGMFVTVTVRNTVDVTRRAVLVLRWTNDDRVERRREPLVLEPGERVERSFEFPELGDLTFEWEAP